MKKILAFLGILLLTGCSVNYNLNIDKDGITENITGSVLRNELNDSNDENADLFKYDLLYSTKTATVDGEGLYEKEIDESSNPIKFNYNYKFGNNYKNSKILDSCYEKVVFEETDKLYVIKLSGDFYCLLNDEITVNVTTNYSVINNNANKVKGNTYTWTLQKGSTDIEMQILKKENNYEPYRGLYYFRLIGFIVFAVLCIIIGYIYIKHVKNSDK